MVRYTLQNTKERLAECKACQIGTYQAKDQHFDVTQCSDQDKCLVGA